MVFRLVQESLTNIAKHAHASEVRVDITMTDSELTVIITDNGVGIASDRRDAVGSHGLATMRHRVRSFGGTLDIESVSPSGTQLRARLPLALILKSQPPPALLAAPQPIAAAQ
jgi:signal transduction histidine kinase